MRILLSPKSRSAIFNFLKEKNNVHTLKELSIKLNVPFKTLSNWHYDYKKYIPEKLLDDFKQNIEILDKQPKNWGFIKGGKIAGPRNIEKLKKLWGDKRYYEIRRDIGKNAMKRIRERYGSEELTRRAIAKRIKKREERSKKLETENENFFKNDKIFIDNSTIRYSYYDKAKRLIFPQELSTELAEEIGIHLGDGCLSYNKKYFSVKTNKKEEDYMIKFIFPLYKKLYNLDLKPMRLTSVIGFEIYSLAFFEFKNKILKIPYGNKVNNKIEVPKIIIDSRNKEIYKAFIRGLFDTDGCVNIVKSKNNYPTITFTIRSEKLIIQVKEMLLKLGFIPYASKWTINLNGKIMLEKWVKEINSNNPKNLVRLQQAISSARIERVLAVNQSKKDETGVQIPDRLS